jgi:hypothetical protein
MVLLLIQFTSRALRVYGPNHQRFYSGRHIVISPLRLLALDPLAFQTATFPLVTSLAIQDTTTLAITDDTQLDGQVTISLRYL